jgi:predicted negative regulator of RcsB-dependent stress response
MTPRQHGDTETRLAGFEARLQDGFDWANAHGREIVIGLATFLVVGGVAAGVFEWRRTRLAASEAELARIEARYTQAMGSTSGELFIAEPANAEQAKKAREATLVELDAFATAQGPTPAAQIARLRAAEIAVDLAQYEDAGKRLESLAADLDPNDARRAVALRLHGYVLDQTGNALGAAERYEMGAQIAAYPPRALLWILAGDTFARAGEAARAIAAYRQALSASPELAEQEGVISRIGITQAVLDSSPPSTAPPTPASTSDK